MRSHLGGHPDRIWPWSDTCYRFAVVRRLFVLRSCLVLATLACGFGNGGGSKSGATDSGSRGGEVDKVEGEARLGDPLGEAGRPARPGPSSATPSSAAGGLERLGIAAGTAWRTRTAAEKPPEA